MYIIETILVYEGIQCMSRCSIPHFQSILFLHVHFLITTSSPKNHLSSYPLALISRVLYRKHSQPTNKDYFSDATFIDPEKRVMS